LNTGVVKALAFRYIISAEDRDQILRSLYKDAGRPGLQALARVMGLTSPKPLLAWLEKDKKARNKSRRQRRAQLPGLEKDEQKGSVQCTVYRVQIKN
jgi:hypothetical protein